MLNCHDSVASKCCILGVFSNLGSRGELQTGWYDERGGMAFEGVGARASGGLKILARLSSVQRAGWR